MKARYILWDFDKTILPFDSDSRLTFDTFKHFLKKGRIDLIFIKSYWAGIAALYFAFNVNYKYTKRALFHVYKGLSLSDIKKFSKKYASKIPKENLDKIKEAKKKGYKSYIFSCGNTQQIKEILKAAEVINCFDKIVANDFVFKNSKIVSGNYLVENPEAKIKVINRSKINFSKAIAIGDGKYDIPMLKKVKYPILLGRKQSMVNIAKKEGWIIVYSLSEVKL